MALTDEEKRKQRQGLKTPVESEWARNKRENPLVRGVASAANGLAQGVTDLVTRPADNLLVQPFKGNLSAYDPRTYINDAANRVNLDGYGKSGNAYGIADYAANSINQQGGYMPVSPQAQKEFKISPTAPLPVGAGEQGAMIPVQRPASQVINRPAVPPPAAISPVTVPINKNQPRAEQYGDANRGITEIFNAPGQRGRSFTNLIPAGAPVTGINEMTARNMNGDQGAWQDTARTDGVTMRNGGSLRTGLSAAPAFAPPTAPVPDYKRDYAEQVALETGPPRDTGIVSRGNTIGTESESAYIARRMLADDQRALANQTKEREAQVFNTGIASVKAKTGMDEASTKKSLAEADALRYGITPEGQAAGKKGEKEKLYAPSIDDITKLSGTEADPPEVTAAKRSKLTRLANGAEYRAQNDFLVDMDNFFNFESMTPKEQQDYLLKSGDQSIANRYANALDPEKRNALRSILRGAQ